MESDRPSPPRRPRAVKPKATAKVMKSKAATAAKAVKAAKPKGRRQPAGNSGTPLPKKLGVRPDSTVAVVDAPPGFASTLGRLPEGARLRDGGRGACDVALWFVATRAEFAQGLHAWARRADWRALWICWPKRSSGLQTDLGEAAVRTYGLAAGLVDDKICALDSTWSGLCFARRNPADHPSHPRSHP
jgi:hypothetical protein